MRMSLLGASIPPFLLILLLWLLPPPPQILGVPDDKAETLRVRWYSGSSKTAAVRGFAAWVYVIPSISKQTFKALTVSWS